MRFPLEHHPLVTSLLAGVVVATVAGATVSPHFQTNDDAAFMLMVSGQVLSSEPSELIYWFHPFLSYTLAWLYRLNGKVPWYGLMHLGSLVFALWAILYAVLLKGCSWQRVGLCLLCVVSLGLPFITSLQFTKTAFLAGLGGILLLATTLQQDSSYRISWYRRFFRLASGIFLLILSLFIRDRSLMLACVASLPVIGFLAWSAWKTGTTRRFLTVLASVSFVLLTLGFIALSIYTQSPGWDRFNRLNPLKSAFLDYQHVSYTTTTQPYFQEVGWSENDYRCLMSWWYVDPQVYSPEKMQAIVAHFPPTTRSSAEIHTALRSFANHCLAEGTTWVVAPLCAALALLGFRSLTALVVLLATLGGVGLVLGFLAVFLKLPPYICQALVTTPCWVALWLSADRQKLSPASSWHFVRQTCGGLLVGVVLMVLLLRSDTPLAKAVTTSRTIMQTNLALRKALGHLAPTPSLTFIVWGSFPYEAILPLESHNYLRGLRGIAIAALNQSPVQQRMLEAQGISDLPRALFERDDVFLSFDSNNQITILTEYLAEHYGVAVTFTPVFDDPPLRFWKVSRSPAP
jgi:hypothetical protein